MDYILPLFVGIPLAMVALAAMLPWKPARDALGLITPAATAAGGAWLFAHTGEVGTIAHSVGLYVGGVAIPFAADQFAAIMIVTTSIVALGANWFAIAVKETEARFYISLTLMLLTGVMGALLTADLFNFFVFIEVMLLPSYGLMAMTGTWARLSAGRTFVLTNLATSTLLLIGVAVVYGVVGSVNIAALAGAAAGNGPVTVAMGIVMIALIVKAGMFPVHTWLPRTYPSTSASVMALFSGLHTKVAVYMVFRVYVTIFDLEARWVWLILVLSVVGMLVGAFAGLAENSMRRILAYQMVNGMPFIVVMLAFAASASNGNGGDAAAKLALAAGILYALHHMITVASLVLATGSIEETYGTDLIKKLSGIARRDPIVAAIFVAGAFSVVGFPPFSGLWGKVGIVVAMARQGDGVAWFMITIVIIASFGAFMAMLRLWRKVFWGSKMNKQRVPEALRVPAKRWAPSGALMVISFGMFIFAGPLFAATNGAAEDLLDVPSYQQAVLHQTEDEPVAVVTNNDLQGASDTARGGVSNG